VDFRTLRGVLLQKAFYPRLIGSPRRIERFVPEQVILDEQPEDIDAKAVHPAV